MKLYSTDLSPFAARCRMLVYHKGLENQVEILPVPWPTKSPEWKRINPIGKIPALQLGDQVIVESEVILDYLEDRFPERPLRPANLEERARARTLGRICDVYVFAALGPLFGQLASKSRDPNVIEPSLQKLHEALAHLEAFLPESGPFAVGGTFSLADCTLVPALWILGAVVPAFGDQEPIARHAKLNRYWTAAAKEAVAAKVIAEMERGLVAFTAQMRAAS